MKRHVERSVLAVAVSSCLLASMPALAITNVEANAGPQFNFVNPGARSLGMGGAFIGLADDATAAYTNPAGLGQLSTKQWSIEARDTNFGTYSVKGGRLVGPPTGIGLDTHDGLQTQTTWKDVVNLSFLSFAFPLEHGTLAVYRHELANFKAHFASNGAFVQTIAPNATPPRATRNAPSINDIDLKIINYGFAGSWRATSKLMLGGSLNYYRFDFDTLTRRYSEDINGDGVEDNLERLTVADFGNAQLSRIATQKGNDGDFGFTAGLLWQPNDRWSVGTVYRRGPSFDYDFAVPATTGPGGTLVGTSGSTDFVVPDVWAVGIGFKPSDAWRVAFDVNRIFYAQHSDNVVAQSTGAKQNNLTVDDSTELRLGAEYTAIEAKHPYELRFGLWHEPAHQLYFDGTIVPFTGTPLTAAETDNNFRAALFVKGKDQMHYSAGYGIVFDKFQIDTALDISTRARVFSLSMVYFLK